MGEDRLNHTPRNERVEVKLGNAFDLVGERKRTAFQLDNARKMMDESFEIKLRNQGKTAVEICVIEHLVRSATWKLTQKSREFKPLDSHTVECVIPVAAGSESVWTYTVHYTW